MQPNTPFISPIYFHKTASSFWVIAITLFILIGSGGCSTSSNETNVISGSTPYFNLGAYFTSEITRLTEHKTTLDKKAALNGKSETQTLQSVDWEKELAIFTLSDINKPAWRDKYTADSSMQGQQLTITYNATDTDLRTQSINLVFEPNATVPKSVTIFNHADNLVYQLTENLNYQSATGYQIQTTQKVVLMNPQSFAIEGRFE